MKKALIGMIIVSIFVAVDVWADRGGEGGRGDGPVIYVTSQGLYYDSIVTADPLPPRGPFQQHRAQTPILLKILIRSRPSTDQEISDMLGGDGGSMLMAMEKWMKG
jgi:hypothetical protein